MYPNEDSEWPTDALRDTPHAVTVTYVSGWTTAADVPDGIKQYIKMYAGALYEHREQLTGCKLELLDDSFIDGLIDEWCVKDFTRY